MDIKGNLSPWIGVQFLDPGVGLVGHVKALSFQIVLGLVCSGQKDVRPILPCLKILATLERRLGNTSFGSSGSQGGSLVTCESSFLLDSEYLSYLFIIKVRGEHSHGRPSCHFCRPPFSASLCSSQCS